ncbi:phage holin family protein [Massilia sp. Dwa41.01b]|uniref:phage holin family protein n=1 Tax=unclassified Massilia TaxID=2609279 RepID=UPI001862360B|nr:MULTISPECIES: phage holin family protein [unclassified Massilia]QNA88561.1 phage holin family protein [Massilia sp. Dwa41.01b]QNA99458.1 phage holin family protein [Massilia sp. Se16.2.3]
MEKTETVVHGPGLMGGISGLAKNLFGLIVSRVELAALEMSEVRNHVIELLAIFAGAVLAVWFALAYGTATIVALAWDAMGWKILLVLFLVFLIITAVLVMKGLSMLKQGKLAFPETMNELRHDRDALL